MLKSLHISDMNFDAFPCRGLKLHTDGRGLWSRRKATVRIKSIALEVYDCMLGNSKEHISHHILAYFDPKDWNIDKDGLIYTDPLFIKELRQFANKHIDTTFVCRPTRKNIASSLDYTEQGMQGNDYVSLKADNSLISLLIEESLLYSITNKKKRA